MIYFSCNGYAVGVVQIKPHHNGGVCMKQKYVPLDKRSKKKQKEYHEMQRKSWGEFNPITRKTDNLNVYNRKKSERRHEYEPCSDFLYAFAIKNILHRFYFPIIGHLHYASILAMQTKTGTYGGIVNAKKRCQTRYRVSGVSSNGLIDSGM